MRYDENFAADAVKLACSLGASDAECTVVSGDEFSVTVRMRDIEQLKEASSQAAGIRVLIGKRTGSSYTSDLSKEGIERMVRAAIELAGITSEDPFAGLPDEQDLGSAPGDFQLYHDNVLALTTEEKIARAKEAEDVSLQGDPRLVNSEGASFGSYTGQRVFANSRGFAGSYRTTSVSISAMPVAQQNGSMERDYWYSATRDASKLEAAAEVGRKAAERTLRRLGARKISTRKSPVMFEPRIAASLLGDIFDAVSGSAVYRNASFLAGKLGQQVAASHFTLIDDAILPGLLGTSPFDDEGVPSRRTVVIDKGELKSYLLNVYSARKLGLRTTGNGSRGVTGNAGVGHGNLFIEPGTKTQQEMLREMGTGLLVTELIGSGVNTVTGDYSRGAAGLWIENGEPAYPVSEITIAGTLQEMLARVSMIGNDLEFRSSVASPTLMIEEMTISGQ
jgi:PmbA protein